MNATTATTATNPTTAFATPGQGLPGPAGRPHRPAVSVPELRRAWAAVQAGAYRAGTDAPWAGDPVTIWSDTRAQDDPTGQTANGWPGTWEKAVGERVLPVLGCTGACGASTVAVAVATAALGGATGTPSGTAVRVVECSPPAASGVAAASASELGRDPSGWLRGQRGDLLLERIADDVDAADGVPLPSPFPTAGLTAGPATSRSDLALTAVPSVMPPGGGGLTVLDVGWDLQHVLARPSWLRDEVTTQEDLLLVTTATVPGLRRLEVQLDLLADLGRTVHAAVIGPRRRRWPRAVAHGLGPHTRALDEAGRLGEVPHDRGLAVLGLSPAPFPTALLRAAARLLPPTTPTQGVTP
ncbi:hypothetical protein [Aquipuribacter hungaricus]|uniref:Uncharacterized protein n=1 Tax=Aquipuribacter hungaricus TaxID=545624 RepID=A0ABV7WHK1_9MICO